MLLRVGHGSSRGAAQASHAASYRIWPPVALGIPLLAGIAMSATIGDPWTLPDAVRTLGWVPVVGFVLWNGWCLWLLRTRRTGLLPGQETRTVVDSGPYRVSRNPLYVGLLLLYVGLGLLAPSTWALLLTPVAVAAVDWGAIRPEEAYLREQFGDEYVDYCRRVRRWL